MKFIVLVMMILAGAAGPAFGVTTFPIKRGGPEDLNRVIAVGDIMLAGSAVPVLKINGISYPFRSSGLAKLISTSDAAFANLEYPITMRQDRFMDKTYLFKGLPQTLAAIKEAGFTLVSLANNHIMDYGSQGLMDTIEQCDRIGLAHAGAGADDASAGKPAVFVRRGVRYGLLAYSLTFPPEFWAKKDRAGTYHPHYTQIQNDIQKARPGADILMVSFHWGEELSSTPKPYQEALAHLAVDAGADMVIGHHPHVAQAIEIYQGKPIFYSLGNFVFGSYSTKVDTGFMAELAYRGLRLQEVNLYPLIVCNHTTLFQPKLAEGPVARKIIKNLYRISKKYNTGIMLTNNCGKVVIPVQ